MLKAAGYATALSGKWQLSGSYPTVVRETGFDEYCIWGYREHYSEDDRAKAEAAGINFRSRYWHPSIQRNGRWVPTTDQDYGPDIFAAFFDAFFADFFFATTAFLAFLAFLAFPFLLFFAIWSSC